MLGRTISRTQRLLPWHTAQFTHQHTDVLLHHTHFDTPATNSQQQKPTAGFPVRLASCWRSVYLNCARWQNINVSASTDCRLFRQSQQLTSDCVKMTRGILTLPVPWPTDTPTLAVHCSEVLFIFGLSNRSVSMRAV